MEPFKSRGVFGKQMNNQRSVSKHMNLQHMLSTTAMSLSKGVQAGIRTAGYTGNKLKEAVSGLNSGLVSPQMRGLAYAGSTGKKLANVMWKGAMMPTKTIGSSLLVGASAMMGVSIMKGGMSQAHDIMMERYMRDARYSSRLLTQTNLGSASGNSSLSMGNHAGLSLALSRTRHGH